MAAPKKIETKAPNNKQPKKNINGKVIPYIKSISVEELHKLSKDFESEHSKDTKALATLSSAQIYLKEYWTFYLANSSSSELTNGKIKKFFKQNAYSETFLMFQLAVNAREVLVKNKISLPFGDDNDEPDEDQLREVMPTQPKVIKPKTPEVAKQSNNEILALFKSMQSENAV